MTPGLAILADHLDKHRKTAKRVVAEEVCEMIRDANLPLSGRFARKLLLPVINRRVDAWIDSLKQGTKDV